jgi:hypothetical protein
MKLIIGALAALALTTATNAGAEEAAPGKSAQLPVLVRTVGSAALPFRNELRADSRVLLGGCLSASEQGSENDGQSDCCSLPRSGQWLPEEVRSR